MRRDSSPGPGSNPGPGPAEAPRPTLARRRRAEASTRLTADREGFFAFEAFIDGLPFLSPREAAAMKLAGGELLDNLIRHASPLEAGAITLRAARRGSGAYLAFFFKSPRFGTYAANSADSGAYGEATAPFFDPLIGRWRGIGLHMCKNLSSSLYLRAGSSVDRIYVSF